jgi:O-antigen ligase
VRHTAWRGKIQLTWVLSLVAPFRLTRFLGERDRVKMLGYGGAWVLTAAAVYVLFSRIGVVAFPLVTALVCALHRDAWRRWGSLLAVGLALVLGLVVVNPALVSTRLIGALVDPRSDASVIDRQDIYRRTVRMIADHPIAGVGLGAYDDVVYAQYGHTTAPHFFRRGMHAHNTPLHVLAETGVVGLAAWSYLWFVITRRLWGRRRAAGAGLGMLLAGLVLSMTEVLTAARVHGSLRMNLTLALLVVYGLRLASEVPGGDTDPEARHPS